MKEKGLNFCSNLLPIYIIGGLWLVKSGSIIHNLSWFPVQILLDGLKSAEKIELKGSTSSQKRQSTCICIYSLKHTLFYAGATQCDIIFLPPIHNTSVFVFVWSCPCTCIGLFVFCICAHMLHAHPRCNAKLYLSLYLFGLRITDISHYRWCTFLRLMYFLVQRAWTVGLFWLFCCKFTHFLVYIYRPK